VRVLRADGTVATVAGTGAAGYAGDGGPASAAALNQPNGVAIDPADGSLFVADRGNFRVRRIGPDGEITTVAGTGVEGNRGDDGPAIAAQLGYVARVAFAPDEAASWLLLADQSNSRVRRINLR